MRVLKVETLGDPRHKKAQIRLKGKWVAAYFQPGTRVEVTLRGGEIVIKPAPGR